MKFSILTSGLEKQTQSCLIIGMFEDGTLTASGEKLNKLAGGRLKKIYASGGFKGKIGEILPLFHLDDFNQLLLVGCGKASTLSPSQFRQILLSTMKSLAAISAKSAICTLQEIAVEEKSLPWKTRQIIECMGHSFYRFDHFKQNKESTPILKTFSFFIEDKKQVKAVETALQEGEAIADAVSFTKNLANLPSNVCTPSFLADQAKDLAKNQRALTVKVLNEKQMHQLGMGALLGVSQGSAEEAKLICLEYRGGAKKQRPVALIGKGITFDTGGNSLKPADSMVGMKYDMCGAATVLGVMKAALSLKLPMNIVGIIPAVENMPGGTAYKPEDILTSLSGQTIEVISTDAEGRLILADALTYCERYQPDVVIDIATLTGAVVIALGSHATGLLSNNDELAEALLTAGKESHDRAWQLPLWDDYQEQIKSPFADMANTGGRSAGTITAACFLSRFAKNFAWAHLDVAGTAANMAGTNERAATGRPVPMLVQYLLNRLK